MRIPSDQLAVWKRWWAGKGGWLINNATLLTHSRIAVPALIAEVERLTEALQGIADGACGGETCDYACMKAAQRALEGKD